MHGEEDIFVPLNFPTRKWTLYVDLQTVSFWYQLIYVLYSTLYNTFIYFTLTNTHPHSLTHIYCISIYPPPHTHTHKLSFISKYTNTHTHSHTNIHVQNCHTGPHLISSTFTTVAGLSTARIYAVYKFQVFVACQRKCWVGRLSFLEP